ncbi:HAD hydrolase-like protein [Mesorhizobium sp. M0184]|uniref:HAD hydrolase-like protein n=1 Tax=Mesorhizobium sp. M0184 TaxID=2956906 RepID=UPI003334BBCB
MTTGGSTQPPDEVAALLKECALRKLLMVCANPDLVVLVGDQLVACAGALAEHYEALGGEVFYHGKPYSSAYQLALDLLGYERHEVLAVGDSLRTDVAAGRNKAWTCSSSPAAYIRTLLITPKQTNSPVRCSNSSLRESQSFPRSLLPYLGGRRGKVSGTTTLSKLARKIQGG